MQDLKKLMIKIKKWWGNLNDSVGILLEQLSNIYNLHLVIDQPTHFKPNCFSSCIDLLFTSEPNQVHESGILPCLTYNCHNIIFAKIKGKFGIMTLQKLIKLKIVFF